MKRITVALAVCFTLALAAAAVAVEWHPANQSTLGWGMEYVVTRPDGSTFEVPKEEIFYHLYRTLSSDTAKENPEFLGETQDMTFLVRFAEEGEYMLGVQAVRRVPNITGELKSKIAWSDDPEATHGNTFGVVFVIPPAAPTGVRAE
jgi:hypothetical protein